MMRYKIFAIALLLTSVLSPVAYGQSDNVPALAPVPAPGPAPDLVKTSDLAIFTPKTQKLNTKIQYGYWDTALGGIVLNLGKSVRRSAMRPAAALGSRRVTGHKSRYRLEGSRVIFSFLKPEQIDELGKYKEYLVGVANKHDLQSFSRDEQLAFWFNLHNVMVIETIARNYPVKHPSKIRIGDKPLHEAQLVTIKGVPLSLQNIREDIVYRNWPSADVIYGFYLGDIGGPALMNYAFTGENVKVVTHDLAEEFVTSLRGFQTTPLSRKISRLYEDVRPYYFSNWPVDLENHLLKYAGADLAAKTTKSKPLRIAKYETAIADIMGGVIPRHSISPTSGRIGWTSSDSNLQTNSDARASSAQMDRFLAEYNEKIKAMRRRDMLPKRGTVTISDPKPVITDEVQPEK